MKPLHLTILISFFFLCASAQNPIGLPQIVNYDNLQYKAGIQNWAVDQDREGRVYFANNEGMLSFDGKHWRLYPLPNKTVVHAVKATDSGRIYVGAQDEIGYFEPDSHGILTFRSLKSFIPGSSRQFADVWNICQVGEMIFFRTTDKIFYLKDNAIKVFRTGSEWLFLGQGESGIFAQEKNKGLMIFRDGTWQIMSDDKIFKEDVITAVLDYKSGVQLVATLKHGLYLLSEGKLSRKETVLDGIFGASYIYSAIAVNKDWFAIGTTTSGCYIIDRAGRVVQQFSANEGLQANYVRNLLVDKGKNLWIALDDGLSMVAFNSAIKQIFPDAKKQISSYSARIFDKHLYVGASNGLFYLPLDMGIRDLSYSKGKFEEVGKLKGQVWGLTEINRKLLLAHEDGAFTVSKSLLSPLTGTQGTWLFEALSSVEPSSHIMAGTYEGLQLLEYEAGRFPGGKAVGPLEKTSLRFMGYDGGSNTVWASHPYRGVFMLKLSSDFSRITSKKILTKDDGLPSTLGNYVFQVKNRIVVATKDGIYEYDDNKKRFQRSDFFYPYLKNTAVHYLKEDQAGNVWFVHEKKLGVIDFSTKRGESAVVYIPELTSRIVSGFEHVYPYDQQNIFVGSNKGIYHINFDKYRAQRNELNVLLAQVKVFGEKDSIVFGGYGNYKGNSPIELPYHNNSVQFEFASTLFEQQNNIEFSYQLSGFDSQWSAWSTKAEKEYTNLPSGTYIFKVKARNNLGNQSAVLEYQIAISPAWYETWWFYLCSFLIVASLILLVIRRQQKQHLKEQERLKYLHQLELEHNEREIVKLHNEKLTADVDYKNKELASITMHLVQRGKLLARIREELLQETKENNNGTELKRVIRMLAEAEKSDSDWTQFARHFDQIHSNFLSRLKERFPDLSSNDLKLCAYLKMNMTSKEIAQLMSITIKAVEVSRYRLRKKLQIPSDVALFDYLLRAIGSKEQEPRIE
ncbi:regulatory LuxR family protein [Arcticibacter pallidicorallinus]|uniref:Regulatory LuxR family protein n=1 Tax=Arcticibacter pallidicorallinus TaxID=1259464 RepID=A0A2T0UB55_9SPHI|nr:triple tyrosine motif-containing protein [Arcticibacter pallidicorallinus]PRY55165.1 regulatory LuxR family protein [Arcticibacter pallidicorallinus]